MTGSAFDALFASVQPSFDAVFGQVWVILPQTRGQNVNGPGGLDPDRPTIEGLVGIFTDKAEMYKASHVYDFQTDKRPGIVTAETRVDFPGALPSGPLDLRAGDIVVRVGDGSHWRISTIQRDAVSNRFNCNLNRLS